MGFQNPTPLAALLLICVTQAAGLKCHCTDTSLAYCGSNGTVKYCETSELTPFCFTKVHLKDDGGTELHYGCVLDSGTIVGRFSSEYGGPRQVQSMYCSTPSIQQPTQYTSCCSDTDYCNKELVPTLKPSPEDDDEDKADKRHPVWIYGVVSGMIVFSTCIGVLVFLYKRHTRQESLTLSVDAESDPILASPQNSRSLNEMIDEFTHSGSGSGLPLLIQRTIARQIELHEMVGKGRFGDVLRGTWRGDNVAVKMFHSREEDSYFREAQVYQTPMLRHENVLGFIAADNKDNGKWTQLWLITDFHDLGALFDYLKLNPVDLTTMLKLCHSAVCGLAHLHMEIFGSDMQDPSALRDRTGDSQPNMPQRKPAIAHRDLKSKNILVKRNGVCCIADLGLAVKHDSENNIIDIPIMKHRVGTTRYMPPEVLEDSLKPHQFEAYKQGDIYSLGMVLWEVTQRVSINGVFDDYMLPYGDMVPSDPSVEEMARVVVIEKKRPFIPNHWSGVPTLKAMSKLMGECWYENPGARLTALRVKKSLSALAELNGLVV